MSNLGIVELLSLRGLDPSAPSKLVRHQDLRYPVDELLRRGWLEAYQCFQSRNVFHRVDRVVAFTAFGGTRALFQGVFSKHGVTSAAQGRFPRDCHWGPIWRDNSRYYYDLRREKGFEDFEGRVVIEWGKGALAWHQKLSNKPVIEVLPPGRWLPRFTDYLEFSLTHDELCRLVQTAGAHPDWRSALQAVAGIYLILAEPTGDLYVGSAHGTEGIWARWAEYARTGHGGNKLLRELVNHDPAYPGAFRFSLLHIAPRTVSRTELLELEAVFKRKLGTRATGLNRN